MSKAKADKKTLPKRFYAEALAAPAGKQWAILLDGKPLKTPARHPLQVAHKGLANAMAEEWRAQREFIDAEAMPLTRLASITIDRAAIDREAWIADIARYAETDLVCYHSPDDTLGRAQHAAFNPLLNWAESAWALSFESTEGLMPIQQPQQTLDHARALIAMAGDAELAALAMITPLLGSVVIAIALWKERITVDQAITASRLDEAHHAAQWGEDEEAAQSWAAKEKDIRAAAFFLTCNHQN